MRRAPRVVLKETDRETLEKWCRAQTVAVRLVPRAQIVLKAAEGLDNVAIAGQLGVSLPTVGQWRRRFASFGLAGIENDAPRSGRPKELRESVEEVIIEATLHTKPKNATHWSTRSLAKQLSVSASMVQRVWKSNGLQPHRMQTFKLSNDRKFLEKLQDIVGLYLNPPEHALVLCADEKSQIQALDRTQPGLPIKKGRCGTMTHDYKRHGTTTLFAAIEMAEGRVIADCMPRHRHQEWIKFLRQIDAQTPADKQLHIIIDNYSTHKHEKVRAWTKRHPRFHFHFIPTSSSWLNLIERFFGELTRKRIRRGTFTSVGDLQEAIRAYIDQHNTNPKPFVWTARVEQILEKVGRARAARNKTRL